MNLLSRCRAVLVLALAATSILPFGSVSAAPSAAAPAAAEPKVVQVEATVRIARLGKNHDMDVQIIEVSAPGSTSLSPGATYKLDYPVNFPNKRRDLAKSNPVLFAALNQVKTHDVVTLTLTDTTDSSRRCWNTGTSRGCSASEETHEYELVAMSDPTGTCLQGAKKKVSFDWNTYSVRLLACVFTTADTSTIVALWTGAPTRAVRSVTASLAQAGAATFTASTTTGSDPDTTADVARVEIAGQLKPGRYRLAGCIDVRHDGESCRDVPTRILSYRPR